jgi:nucleotide-binding universal stress UspA family protein
MPPIVRANQVGRHRPAAPFRRLQLQRNQVAPLWRRAGLFANLAGVNGEGDAMRGTVVCVVIDGAQNDDAVAQAIAFSDRLGLRLVLAHVVEGITTLDHGDESVTMKAEREAAERLLVDLAREHRVEETAERRVAVGDPACALGQIATEEAADVIVVGAYTRGWRRRHIESRLAEELETETAVPVLIAAPRARRAGRAAHAGNGHRR